MENKNNSEEQRIQIQVLLDKKKSQVERNLLGQFSTPINLAIEILNHAKTFFSASQKISFLDPAIGTGVFYSALSQVFNGSPIEKAVGFEIDEHYGKPSMELWSNTLLEYKISDYTREKCPIDETEKFNLIICNPPYVRHHHFTKEKNRLKEIVFESSKMELSGLSGLYCHFLGIAHTWMKKDGIAGWLIPSEFMDVNYGKALKKYLLEEVTLMQIHRFAPTDLQFQDALVSSTVVWIKNTKPHHNHKVKFTFGSSLSNPQIEKLLEVNALKTENKWSRFPILNERIINSDVKLKDYFTIKRGIATGDNNYFILTKKEIIDSGLPLSEFQSILPSPRFLSDLVIEANNQGYPNIKEQLFVLNSNLSIEEIKLKYPSLYNYIEIGINKGVPDRYLCSKRKIWYSQESRNPSQFYCTYIGRSENGKKKTFRFIHNKSNAIVSNSFLILYPNNRLLQLLKDNENAGGLIAEELNNLSSALMIEEGRVYGGGMYKMEPKELANVDAKGIEKLLQAIEIGKKNSVQHRFGNMAAEVLL